jgi:signal transduction histidine kinase
MTPDIVTDSANLSQRTAELLRLREIVLHMDSAATVPEVYQTIVERALDIPGVSWAIVHQADENEEYLNTPYYATIHNKSIIRALKPFGIDLNKMLGRAKTSNKWRLKVSKLKFAQDYMSRDNPGVVTFERFSEVMSGFWPKKLCDSIQKVGGHTRYVLVPVLPEYEPTAAILFFITGDTSTDVLEMIGVHCTIALNTVARLKFLEETRQKLIASEQALTESNQALVTVNRAKDEFLSLMSHELRTPMNAIMGFSELLYDGIPGDVNEEQQSCLQDILSSGGHLLQIINDIIDISRIESGKTVVNPRSFELRPVVVEAVNNLTPQINRKGQVIVTKIPDDQPMIFADRVRTAQVLMNLLTNASKYTGYGGSIGIECSADQDHCQVCVSDNGIGIPEIYHETIFNQFTQLQTAPDSSERGLGLGLRLSRELITLMQGQIWLDSVPGQGSKFYFTVPLHK